MACYAASVFWSSETSGHAGTGRRTNHNTSGADPVTNAVFFGGRQVVPPLLEEDYLYQQPMNYRQKPSSLPVIILEARKGSQSCPVI